MSKRVLEDNESEKRSVIGPTTIHAGKIFLFNASDLMITLSQIRYLVPLLGKKICLQHLYDIFVCFLYILKLTVHLDASSHNLLHTKNSNADKIASFQRAQYILSTTIILTLQCPKYQRGAEIDENSSDVS